MQCKDQIFFWFCLVSYYKQVLQSYLQTFNGGFVNFLKVNNYFRVIHAVVPFWRKKVSSRNNDNPIVNKETIENLVEIYILSDHLVADYI